MIFQLVYLQEPAKNLNDSPSFMTSNHKNFTLGRTIFQFPAANQDQVFEIGSKEDETLLEELKEVLSRYKIANAV